MIKMKRVAVCLLMLIMVSFGVALTLKAAIGVGAWDALSQTLSNLTGIKVGTVGMLMNFTCVAVELLILRRNFRLSHGMQLVISAVIGFGVNFFYYDVLGKVELNSYVSRVIVLVIAYCINSFTGACLILLNMGTFAIEGACKVFGDKIGKPFHILRQGVDVICIVLCVIMTLIFGTTLTVREGTIIGTVIYGPMMGIFTRLMKPVFRSFGLIDDETAQSAPPAV